MWSYRTSTTRSGLSGTKLGSLPALHRLAADLRGVRAIASASSQSQGWPSKVVTSGCSPWDSGPAPRVRERPDGSDEHQVVDVVMEAEWPGILTLPSAGPPRLRDLPRDQRTDRPRACELGHELTRGENAIHPRGGGARRVQRLLPV